MSRLPTVVALYHTMIAIMSCSICSLVVQFPLHPVLVNRSLSFTRYYRSLLITSTGYEPKRTFEQRYRYPLQYRVHRGTISHHGTLTLVALRHQPSSKSSALLSFISILFILCSSLNSHYTHRHDER